MNGSHLCDPFIILQLIKCPCPGVTFLWPGVTFLWPGVTFLWPGGAGLIPSDLHVLNWLLANYDSYKTSIWHPQVCVLAARYGYVDVLQWAVAHGCNWSKSDCCICAIENKQLKVLIWMKFQAPSYSQYESKYWYGDSRSNIIASTNCFCSCNCDFAQWLLLHFFGNEMFEEKFEYPYKRPCISRRKFGDI